MTNDIQNRVQEALDQLVGSGAERGVQVAVYHRGAQLVDAVAGVADPATGRPVTSDTPFVGELVRRATGKRISQLLLEEISGPLGAADELYQGMPESEQHRLAKLEDAQAAAEMPELPPDLPILKAAPPALLPNAALGSPVRSS